MIKIEKIGDIYQLLCPAYLTNQLKPKKITLDLSENGAFYHTRIYVDVVDRIKNKTYDAYIECKSGIPSFVNNFDVLCDFENKDEAIFTLTIPEE